MKTEGKRNLISRERGLEEGNSQYSAMNGAVQEQVMTLMY